MLFDDPKGLLDELVDLPKELVAAVLENTLDDPDLLNGFEDPPELVEFQENGFDAPLFDFEKGLEFDDLKGLGFDDENGLLPLPEFEFDLDENGLLPLDPEFDLLNGLF